VLAVGHVVAAKLLTRTGPGRRFPSAAAFASFSGVAPIEVSFGEIVRHRLSRPGDRQLDYALHVLAITQVRYAPACGRRRVMLLALLPDVVALKAAHAGWRAAARATPARPGRTWAVPRPRYSWWASAKGSLLAARNGGR